MINGKKFNIKKSGRKKATGLWDPILSLSATGPGCLVIGASEFWA